MLTVRIIIIIIVVIYLYYIYYYYPKKKKNRHTGVVVVVVLVLRQSSWEKVYKGKPCLSHKQGKAKAKAGRWPKNRSCCYCCCCFDTVCLCNPILYPIYSSSFLVYIISCSAPIPCLALPSLITGTLVFMKRRKQRRDHLFIGLQCLLLRRRRRLHQSLPLLSALSASLLFLFALLSFLSPPTTNRRRLNQHVNLAMVRLYYHILDLLRFLFQFTHNKNSTPYAQDFFNLFFP